MTTLRKAAQAVIDRWDAPLWKDVPATAAYIADLRTALAAPEQKPYGWMVQGVPTVMRGSLAKEIQEGEAARIGGTCIAFPVYREPVDIEALTKERDALAKTLDAIENKVDALIVERDALKDAAKLALDFVNHVWRDVSLNDFSEDMRLNVEIALRQAGVQ